MDRFPDSWIGSAAADVAAHGVVDLLVGGVRIRLEQGRGAHDLARLAEAALRHAELDPRRLAGVLAAVVGESLDRGDVGELRHANVDAAGAHGAPVEMDGARAALGNAAAELGALEPQNVAQGPE